MDKPNVIIEKVPENNTVQEQANSVGAESSPIAEFVQTSPAQTQVVDDVTTTNDPITQPDEELDKTVTKEDVADLTSESVLPADDNWVHKVRQVIKDDSGQPYKEEEDAEKLNEEYMKDRFNVDVDAPTEEKN